MLAEVALVLPLALAIVAGAGVVLKAEWDRSFCAWKTFEAVHARRIGKPTSRAELAARVSIAESPGEVRGSGSCGRASESVSLPRLEPDGFFHVPLALALLIVVGAGLGITGLLHSWRIQVSRQLELDTCVKDATLALKNTIQGLRVSNRVMQANRAALVPATIAPPVRAALTATLIAEYAYQETLIGAWNLRRVTWHLASGACIGGPAQEPLPELAVSRIPPSDALGPLPLQGLDVERSYFIQRNRWPRASAATVDAALKARWTVPHGTNPLW